MRTAALVAASSFNAQEFLHAQSVRPYDEIVAVDAGYAHLQSLDVHPTFALGDFDSLGFVPADIPLITFPEEKDDSDLGLALDWCAQLHFDEVTVYGAFAGRLDHTLAALQTMAGYAMATRREVQGVACTERLVIMPARSELFVSTSAQSVRGQMHAFCSLPKEKRTVSVISLANCSQNVSIQGMKYALDGGNLTNSSSLGLSNELVGKEVHVSVDEGCLVVVLPLSQEFSLSIA